MDICLKLFVCALYILLCAVGFTSGNIGMENEFIVVDGIRVRKSDQINIRAEQKIKAKKAKIKDSSEEEDSKLYNESREVTKHLPSKCQVCRLMVSEIQRKLKTFGKVKTFTSEGRPVYYKDDMVIWHVFDELCEEMKKYNIDKKTPFRYRRGGTGRCLHCQNVACSKSYLRRQTDEMTAHAPNIQWVWNIEPTDIDDPTGEIGRLEKQCYKMLVKYQDDVRRWFYTSQKSNPLKWICANTILSRRDAQGCLWIKDKYLDELVNYDKTTSTTKEEDLDTMSGREEKHHEL